jgi:Pyruvate/2-oxoacid:ferredoxin oxidoreductase gamma subunit
MNVDFNFMVGGEAGQGVQLAGFLLAKRLGILTYFKSLIFPRRPARSRGRPSYHHLWPPCLPSG